MSHAARPSALRPGADPRLTVEEHLAARSRLARIVLELDVLEATAALAAEREAETGAAPDRGLERRTAALGRTCGALLERQAGIDAQLLGGVRRRVPPAAALRAAGTFAAQVAAAAGEAEGVRVLASARWGDDGVTRVLDSLAALTIAAAGDLLARLRDAVDVPDDEPDSRWAAKPGLPTPLSRAQRAALRASSVDLAKGRDRLLRLAGPAGGGRAAAGSGAWAEAEVAVLDAARRVPRTLTTLEVRGLVTVEELDEAAEEMAAHRIRGAALPRTETGEGPAVSRRRWRAALLPDVHGDPLRQLERASLVARVRLGPHEVDRRAPIPAALPEDVHGPGRCPAWKENGSRRERWLADRAEERREGWIRAAVAAAFVLPLSGLELVGEGVGWLGSAGILILVLLGLGLALRRGPAPVDLRTVRRARDHARLRGLLWEEDSAYLVAVDPDPAAEAAYRLQASMLTVALREAEELGETPSGPGGGEEIGRRVDALEQRVAVLERGEREAADRLASLLAAAQGSQGRRSV